MLISIIIPVYNKEKYLNDCLTSVAIQDYKNIEVIIINDGSTDNSDKIIRKWISNDSRFRCLSQENRGVSYARNIGISNAKGKYIFLLDADDTLERGAISKLVNYAVKTEADIIIGNHKEITNGKVSKKTDFKEKIIKQEELKLLETKIDMFITNGRPMVMAGNKLYKLDFIRKSGIKFEENVLAEDFLFNLKCYVNSPVIQIVSDYTYNYNILQNTRSRSYNPNFQEEVLALFYSFKNYLKEKSLRKYYDDLLYLVLMYDMNKIINYTVSFSKRKYSSTSEIVNKLRNNTLIYMTLLEALTQFKFKKNKYRNKKNIRQLIMVSSFLIYAPKILINYKIIRISVGKYIRKLINYIKN